MNPETLSAVSESIDSGLYFARVLIFGIPLIYILALLGEKFRSNK